ncbi:patatin-like phospholipase family protein [Reinekea sp.]|jgi:NTE family protein|uniref:patatin-like phospholipase family protein n=1 Tax=Reinekea sp. TaxID=1970455 RepID=UPI002A80AC1F|nr:patatin-like phospholipase family protein [Reinekea sp.]
MRQQAYCLVLGGGGAKGVYHIGVWQALKEMAVPVDAFIGNSIGAVVAAFLAQGADEELLSIAGSINLSSLIRLNEGQALADEGSLGQHSLSYWRGVYKNVVNRKGLDTRPMRTMLEQVIDEKSIRASGCDFGITTVNISDFKPREVFLEQMEPDQLINYVMASAAFPGFERPEIAGKKYLDGGLYDNVPYTMAKRRGYRKIILVDVSGIGLHRRPRIEGSQTVYIKNSIDMGNAFDFDPTFIQRFRKLGYLDTLRAFGELVGYQYFIEPDARLEQQCAALLNETALAAGLHPLLPRFPTTMSHDRRQLLKLLEVCAELLDVERIERYSYAALHQAILNQVATSRASVETFLAHHRLEETTAAHQLLDGFFQELMQNRTFADNPYYYHLLLGHFKPSKTLKLAAATLVKLNPTLALVDFYLECLANRLAWQSALGEPPDVD